MDCTATALTRLFDGRITSSTGNHWRRVVEGATEPYTPLTLAAGQSGRITVTFTPDEPAVQRVSGTLTVTTLDVRTGFAMEVAAVPYAY
ncbi:hypothetical protein ACLQ28_14825 [Micromonospora sp. DT201]|uniref:hypothetical protein n=1 Tax=Micromonospora sp. DT201 TaxID=3393442 RepID=UPI003CF758E4